jgi:aspartate dehydrogenase
MDKFVASIVGTFLLSRLLIRSKVASESYHSRTKPRKALRVGIIGYGAIGKPVADAIISQTHGLSKQDCVLCSILVQRERPAQPLATTSFDQFMSTKPDVVIEAAGQPTVREHGLAVLTAGASFLVTSIGAFTDDSLFALLSGAAARSGSRLLLASGALPALDWMHSAAAQGGEQTVTIEQRKAPAAWLGACVDGDSHDYVGMTATTTVFEGTAREAATCYPKNANISAMLGLSTCGLDKCRVKLVADCGGSHGTVIHYESAEVGSVTVEVKGKMSPTNPRTSAVVSLAVIKAMKNLVGAVGYGV